MRQISTIQTLKVTFNSFTYPSRTSRAFLSFWLDSLAASITFKSSTSSLYVIDQSLPYNHTFNKGVNIKRERFFISLRI